jgi:ABC-type thiamin/hydroxymethylpyrimidine transport system permease subunit
LLLVLLLIGGWPLVALGQDTSARTWGFSVIAVALGVLLAVWLRSHLIRALAAKARTRAVRVWVIAATAAWVLIAGAPSGVRMIYSAAIEGVICAVVFFGVRDYLRIRRLRTDISAANDEGDR